MSTYLSGRDLNCDAGIAYGSWWGDKGYSEKKSPSAYETEHSPWSTKVAELDGRELYRDKDGSYHSHRANHGSTYVGFRLKESEAIERWYQMIEGGAC